jgi:type IV pilus assembly protein PilX
LSHHNRSVKKEQGMVLIFSMVILVLITMLGMATLNIASLEKKMAANMQNSLIALQSAESVLSECERYLRETTTVDLEQRDRAQQLIGLVDEAFRIIDANQLPEQWWLDEVFWQQYGFSTKDSTLLVADGELYKPVLPPKCMIEYIGNGASAMDSDTSLYRGSNSADAKLLYRVTAFSYGASTLSQSIIQSHFIKH